MAVKNKVGLLNEAIDIGKSCDISSQFREPNKECKPTKHKERLKTFDSRKMQADHFRPRICCVCVVFVLYVKKCSFPP